MSNNIKDLIDVNTATSLNKIAVKNKSIEIQPIVLSDEQQISELELSEKCLKMISDKYFTEYRGEIQLRKSKLDIKPDFDNETINCTEIVQFLIKNCNGNDKYIELLTRLNNSYKNNLPSIVNKMFSIFDLNYQKLMRSVYVNISRSQLEVITSIFEYQYWYLILDLLKKSTKKGFTNELNDFIHEVISQVRGYKSEEYFRCSSLINKSINTTTTSSTSIVKRRLIKSDIPIEVKDGGYSIGLNSNWVFSVAI